jgi:SAM-dependent methyltransferase
MNDSKQSEFLRDCPACGSEATKDLGVLHHSLPLMVARVPLNIENDSFHYLRCNECSFHFKSPEIPTSALMECYSQAEGDRWGLEIDPIERNFDRVAQAIRRHTTSGRILDVGCSNGSFLSYLPGQWRRYGIEPSSAASEIAREREIDIICPTIEEVSSEYQFDVVVAMDLIEHLTCPRDFFSAIARLLPSNGLFVVTTGDTGSWSWRLQSERYWYCSAFPEHVSFYNFKCLDKLAESFGMKTIAHDHMSYKRTSLATRGKESFKGILYSGLRQTNWLGLPLLHRKFNRRGGTNWASASDHMIHVMQKLS